jgi:hypothetical protein
MEKGVIVDDKNIKKAFATFVDAGMPSSRCSSLSKKNN